MIQVEDLLDAMYIHYHTLTLKDNKEIYTTTNWPPICPDRFLKRFIKYIDLEDGELILALHT